jgi:hypothetical protein
VVKPERSLVMSPIERQLLPIATIVVRPEGDLQRRHVIARKRSITKAGHSAALTLAMLRVRRVRPRTR